MLVRCWYLIQTVLRLLEFWDLLNSRGPTFCFFSIQVTFINSNDWCTTVILSSILTMILVPDLVLFKFRHETYFCYFQTFFWMAILLGGICSGNANLSFSWTWTALCLKLCFYDKKIPFCYQHFQVFFFFCKMFL